MKLCRKVGNLGYEPVLRPEAIKLYKRSIRELQVMDGRGVCGDRHRGRKHYQWLSNGHVAKQYWHWHKTGTLSLGTAGKCRPFVPFSFTVTLLLAPKRSIAVWVYAEFLSAAVIDKQYYPLFQRPGLSLAFSQYPFALLGSNYHHSFFLKKAPSCVHYCTWTTIETFLRYSSFCFSLVAETERSLSHHVASTATSLSPHVDS